VLVVLPEKCARIVAKAKNLYICSVITVVGIVVFIVAIIYIINGQSYVTTP